MRKASTSRVVFLAATSGMLVACSAILGIGDLPGTDVVNDGGTDSASSTGGGPNGDAGDGGEVGNAPRLISPLSTSKVTTRRPSLRWALPTGVTATSADICADRACSLPIVGSPFSVSGTTYNPKSDLPSGVLFWRVHSSTTVSSTWQFNVGVTSRSSDGGTRVDTSWGTTFDVNGDGYSDLVVGADRAVGGAGRVYIYFGGETPLATLLDGGTHPDIILDAPEAEGFFGVVCKSAGDLNGDGYSDLVVTADSAPGGGRAYVYYGGKNGLTSLTPSVTLISPDGGSSAFGNSATSGDINGDGYSDLVVGEPDNDNGEVYVYLGGPSGPAAIPSERLDGPIGTGAFGYAVAAGNINGDGYDDLLATAAGGNGSAFIFHGGAGGLINLSDGGTVPAAFLTPTADQDADPLQVIDFGTSAATAGDLNEDGYADMLVGAPGGDNYFGRVYVYFGSPSGVSALTPATINGSSTDSVLFGYAVASTGDNFNDGVSDIIVGGTGAANELGRAYLFQGQQIGIGEFPSPGGYPTGMLDGGVEPGELGHSVACAGDLNRDGFDDFVVGAPGQSGGRAYIYFGGPSLSSHPNKTLLAMDGDGGRFGNFVFGATH